MGFPSHTFRVGDIVCLRTGHARQRVTKIKDHVISTKYLSSFHTRHHRAAAHFLLLESQTVEEEEEIMSNIVPLYKFTLEGKEVYGTHQGFVSQLRM